MTKENLQNAPQNTTVSLVESNNNQTSPQMLQQSPKPNLLRLEQYVAEKDYELACRELMAILEKMDANFGGVHDIEFDAPAQLAYLPEKLLIYFATRLANAITTLFSDPELAISEEGALKMISLQRWLTLIFASSPYVNADHILNKYNINPDSEGGFHLATDNSSIAKFCIFYLPESNVNMSLDALWAGNQQLCASLCFALQSSRFIGTASAFHKRAVVLQWFPKKLAEIADLNELPANILHDVYMHCSYDLAKNKHDVKRPLNELVRKHILTQGWQDRYLYTLGKKDGKPVMMVLLEHFNSGHSIYRTHSTSMIAAREKFYLVGLGSESVDEIGREVFDEFFEISSNNIMERLFFIRKQCETFQPAVFYMPSIGMDITTIFVSNTRLAPIQAVALGHPATTHSEFIDYVLVEDDYVGSEDCFSETLLRLPKDALPYVPSALAPQKVDYVLRENPEVVNIGIAATTMKLNPEFLVTLQEIRDKAKVKIHFHFALGQSTGLTHPYVKWFIESYLGDDATAHPHAPYHDYLAILRDCDMLLNPFPFGNTNGIIDMVTLGLVGVCKTGDEVHEHIDEGLFKRLGLPEWLIADTRETYIECALRLAENHQERLELRRYIIENNGLQKLFTGDPRPLGKILLKKTNEWKRKHLSKK